MGFHWWQRGREASKKEERYFHERYFKGDEKHFKIHFRDNIYYVHSGGIIKGDAVGRPSEGRVQKGFHSNKESIKRRVGVGEESGQWPSLSVCV